MRSDYRRWLEAQEYSPNTINTQISHASKLEQAYGDLDELYARGGYSSMLASLRYTSDEGRRGAANPSKLTIGGDLYKALASFRAAAGLYARFLQNQGEPAAEEPQAMQALPTADPSRERLGLERDLQKSLRREIGQLESGLSVIDEGVERAVASGFIDITARDSSGAIVAIELKAGTADRAAVGQILSYMGDLVEEEGGAVRGILIAHDFDRKARSAARMVPNLSLRSYSVRFEFGDPLSLPS